MISKTCIIPWHEFKYMPIDHINQFCSEKNINIKLNKNTLAEKKSAWQYINSIYYLKHTPTPLTKKLDVKDANKKTNLCNNILTDTSKSTNFCAHALGISYISAWRLRKKLGIKIDFRYTNKIEIRNLTDMQKKLIFDVSLSVRKCSALTKIPISAVLKIRQENGIRTKNCNK